MQEIPATKPKKTPQQIIGENIRIQRCVLNISQRQLAQSVGLSRQAIGQIELGKQTLPAEYLFPLAKVLECTIEEIIYAQDSISKMTFGVLEAK